MGLITSLCNIPFLVLFFAAWILASVFRPVLVACLLACLYNPIASLKKSKLVLTSLKYLAFCRDKTWKEPTDDPLSYFSDADDNIETKTIIFVRHGESTWNDTFNRGDRKKLSFLLNFIPNLIHAIFYEWYFFVSGQASESWFFDSPLSEKGLSQALDVHEFLQSNLTYKTPKEADLIRAMLGVHPTLSSKLISSNLRRAISTMAIGFQERLSRTGDEIAILPQLQEVSRNPDALSITPPHEKVVPSWTDPDYLVPILKKHCDTSRHTGNKAVTSNGLLRMQEFCRVAFEFEEDCLVVAGHSLWFQSFFQTYLPRQLEHISKTKKLTNGGCVGLVLKRNTTNHQYMIDPSSITVLHGGF